METVARELAQTGVADSFLAPYLLDKPAGSGGGDAQDATNRRNAVPKLFEGTAWKTLNRSVLSTSHISSPMLWGSAMGPSVTEGWAVSYNVNKRYLQFCVTCFLDGGNKAVAFLGALKTALDFVQRLLVD